MYTVAWLVIAVHVRHRLTGEKKAFAKSRATMLFCKVLDPKVPPGHGAGVAHNA